MRNTFFTFILLLTFVFGCSNGGQSELSRALSSAVKQKKVSQNKMQSVIAEYEKLREEDATSAREYAINILTAIEAGGDSTHIDALRRELFRKRNEGKVGV